MARSFSGSSSGISSAHTSLASSSGPWTVSIFIKPANLTQTSRYMAYTDNWSLIGGFTGTSPWQMEFYDNGTTLRTGSQIDFDSDDVANGAWITYRFNPGAADTWCSFKNDLPKVVIGIGTTKTFGGSTGTSYLGRSNAGNRFVGILGEYAIWTIALTDAQVADLHSGIMADQICAPNLIHYAPLRGTGAVTEPDYSTLAKDYTLTGNETSAAHPTTRAYDIVESPEPAWCAEIQHSTGYIYAASRDLAKDWKAVDTLGAAHQKLILSDEIRIVQGLADETSGFDAPVQFTLSLDNAGRHYDRTVLADSPVAYWKLNETSGTTAANAVTGGSYPGTYTGGYTLNRGPGGLEGYADAATLLNGSSGYITVADNAALDITGNMTITCLVCPLTSGANMVLVGKGTGGSPTPFRFLILNTNALNWSHGGTSVSSTTTLTRGRWHHCIVVRASNVIYFWINGVYAGTGSPTGTPTANTSALEIGRNGDASLYLDGLISRVGIYDFAFTKDQIDAHFAAYSDPRSRFDPHAEWRGVSVILRAYDASNHERRDLFRGSVQDARFVEGRALLTVSNEDAALEQTLIPSKVVNIDDFENAHHIGLPIPVTFGRGAWMQPVPCGRDVEGSPGGYDFMIGWPIGNTRIAGVYEESNLESGALAKLFSWRTAPGSPTYSSSSVFTVTGDKSKDYGVTEAGAAGGIPVRYFTTASPSTYVYNWVTGYNSAASPDQVTLAIADLDAGLTGMQVATNYVQEEGRYSLGGTDLLSFRLFAQEFSAILAEVQSDVTNPADVIEEILSNTDWGGSSPVNATSFADAVTELTSASLDNAIQFVLGGDRQQQLLGLVVRDLMRLRGMRLTKDITAGTWNLEVDQAGTATRYLGFCDGKWNNVLDCPNGLERTPLANAVATLRVHWGRPPKTRSTNTIAGIAAFVATESQWYCDVAVGSVGKIAHLVLPYVRNANAAKRVAYYLGRRMQMADYQLTMRVDYSLRHLSLREPVYVRAPHLAINEAPYRVRSIEYTSLGEATVRLEKYIAETFTYDGAIVAIGSGTGNDEENPLVLDPIPGFDGNPCYNADFTIPLSRQWPTSSRIHEDYLPGFWIPTSGTSGWTTCITELRTTTGDSTAGKCIGNGYLTITTTRAFDISTGTEGIYPLRTRDSTGAALGRFRASGADVKSNGEGSDVVIYSIYCSAEPFYVRFYFYDDTFTLLDDAVGHRIATGETNENGWARYYFIVRVHAETTQVEPWIVLEASGTYNFDAQQFEIARRGSGRPSAWTQNPESANDPYRLKQGDFFIRPSGQAENSTYMAVKTYQTAALSGATVDISNALQAGWVVRYVTAVVHTAVTGATTWSLGTAATPTLFAATKALTKGTQVSIGDNVAGGFDVRGTYYAANTNIRLTANGSNFSGGVIVVSVHYEKPVPPTVAT